ncbi:Golgi-associated plant pathogenesis-related protein 1-like [Convolutriloba macropyga]|uniref:Golgi-associated plant pathogenesis-related protein 1-like n=1 Tax=Convolutriloba macropyga TaxID=536237 RepID=UPI003F51E73E
MGCGTSKAKSSSDVNLTDEEFIHFLISEHNNYREKHGVPPLKTSESCQKEAQNWAEKMAETGYKEHNVEQKDFGENIYKSSKPVSRKFHVTSVNANNNGI